MGDIYRNGTLNLAATASEDRSGGLFHSDNSLARNPCLPSIPYLDCRSGDYMCHPIPIRELWEQNVEKASLGQRGWVMQERVVSPRVIHFAADLVN
jgi:hypothetical protein